MMTLKQEIGYGKPKCEENVMKNVLFTHSQLISTSTTTVFMLATNNTSKTKLL